VKIRILTMDFYHFSVRSAGEISKALADIFDGAHVPQIYKDAGLEYLLVTSEPLRDKEQGKALWDLLFRSDNNLFERAANAVQEVEL